jgi:hypothetical protein
MTTQSNPPLVPQTLLPEVTRKEVVFTLTPQRVHDIALQNWLYGHFFVTEGYPVPVVFATPMDAFSEFGRLWAAGDSNPFKYLLDLKDKEGNALYEPYPANVRYPLISVKRSSFVYRTTQSYGIHNYRRISYPSVSSNLTQSDLGNVTQAGMPTGWDFKYQVEHWCTRPDTQSVFVHNLMRALSHSGGIPQAFICVIQPPVYGPQMCRLYMDGNIENITEDEPADRQVVYRTSVNLTLEGYSVDIDTKTLPAMWQITMGTSTVSKDSIGQIYGPDVVVTEDYRDNPAGSVFATLPNLPPAQQ